MSCYASMLASSYIPTLRLKLLLAWLVLFEKSVSDRYKLFICKIREKSKNKRGDEIFRFVLIRKVNQISKLAMLWKIAW